MHVLVADGALTLIVSLCLRSS